MIEPAWIDPDRPTRDEGWSLVCRFAPAPREQGNPTKATVRFALEEAPQERLHAGAILRLFERDTRQYATVAILD